MYGVTRARNYCTVRRTTVRTPKKACSPGPSKLRPLYASTLGTAMCASSMEYRCPCAAAEPHRTVGMYDSLPRNAVSCERTPYTPYQPKCY